MDISKLSADLQEIRAVSNNINHLETVLIEKKRFRKTELDRLRKEFDMLIQTYGTIIKVLLQA
jgi:hypothetical protein